MTIMGNVKVKTTRYLNKTLGMYTTS